MRCSQNLPLQAFKPLGLAKWEKFNKGTFSYEELVILEPVVGGDAKK